MADATGNAAGEPSRKRTKIVIEQFLSDIRKLVDYLPSTLPEPAISCYDFGDVCPEELSDYGPEACTPSGAQRAGRRSHFRC